MWRLDVARQLLAGTLAPTKELWTALTAALLDETPLTEDKNRDHDAERMTINDHGMPCSA